MELVPPLIVSTLKKANQEHVLKYVSSKDVSEEERMLLYKQVRR